MIQKTLTVEEICRKLKPVLGSKIDEIYLRYTIADSREEKEEIKNILSTLYEKNLNKLLSKDSLLVPPKQSEIDGEYPLGEVSYAGKNSGKFNLREKDWPRHVCISGMSGSGKTNLAFEIVENFIDKNKNFLVFDWKKSFRPLLLKDNKIMCFTIGNEHVSNYFKTNINRPPQGISAKEWINVLCDLLAETFNVSFGVHKILLETLDEEFEKNGVYKDSNNYPTWHKIKEALERKAEKFKGRQAQWIESSLRIASVLTFGEFGKTINSEESHGFKIEDFPDKKIILELNSLGNIEKTFFCEFILTYLYKMKKAQHNAKDNSFDYAIVVDEAHNIFLKSQTNFSKESITDQIYREIREYGVSLICLDQHLSKLSDTVKGNSACHIAFQQQLPQDIWDISELMQLREKKNIFSELQVGSAIVKLSERYTDPFLINVKFNPLTKENITDMEVRDCIHGIMSGNEVVLKRQFDEPIEELKEIVENFDEKNPFTQLKQIVVPIEMKELTAKQEILLEFVNSKLKQGMSFNEVEKLLENHKQEGNYTTSDVMKAVNKAFDSQFTKQENTPKKHSETPGSNNEMKVQEIKEELDLDKDEKKLYNFLLENPNHELTTVNLYKACGLSARKGNEAKNNLLEKNIIEIKEFKNEKGWKKIITINQSYSPIQKQTIEIQTQ